MANLNTPFLLMSKSSFNFVSNDHCFSSMVDNQQNQSVLAYSSTKGEVVLYNTVFDQRTVRKRRTDKNLEVEYRSYYHVILHPKLLLVPNINMDYRTGYLVDSTVM